MLAKDCGDHPLHHLAAAIAQEVSTAIYTDYLVNRNKPVNVTVSNGTTLGKISERNRLVDRIFRHPDFFLHPAQHITQSVSNTNPILFNNMSAFSFSQNIHSISVNNYQTCGGTDSCSNEFGTIERFMTDNIVKLVLDFVKSVGSNQNPIDTNVMEKQMGGINNALAILGRPREGLLPQLTGSGVNLVHDLYSKLTDKTDGNLGDYSSYLSAFVHGVCGRLN